MDWFCLPRFDSPSVFGALLDDARGGHFRIRPTGDPYTSKQVYYPDSAVLVTRFFTEAGVGEVADFMPVVGAGATDRHRLVRIVRCVRGRMSFSVDVAPRFDYGRRPHRTYATGKGAVFTGAGLTLTLHFVRDPGGAQPPEPAVEDGDLHTEIELVAGQTAGVVLESAATASPREVPLEEARQVPVHMRHPPGRGHRSGGNPHQRRSARDVGGTAGARLGFTFQRHQP